MMKKFTVFSGLVLFVSGVAAAGLPDIVPARLRCEYRENPQGIDALKPRLSWVLEERVEGVSQEAETGDRNCLRPCDSGLRPDLPGSLAFTPRSKSFSLRGIRQAAYQVLVASSEELLKNHKGDLWDSGKVVGDQTIHIEYQGKVLESRMRCYWKVKVWTGAGESWSQTASWTMGLLQEPDWQAKWIKPDNDNTSPWLRKEFTLEAVPERAVASVNVKGYCELYVNGQKVSEDVLSPAVTVYAKRTRYNTYDISKYLRSGKNCVGAWMGLGLWYRRGETHPDPVPLARIQLDMTVRGKPVVVGTDASWTWMASTHTEHWWNWNENGREEIDMRRDVPDWSEVGCKNGDWKPVVEHPERTGVASAQSCPPTRITKTIPLVKCTALNTNTVELDFGTNLNGWLRLRLPQMKSGDKVTMHFADKRFQTPEGDNTPIGSIGVFGPGVKTFNSSQGPVTYQTHTQKAEYISAGKPGEQYCARFNYFSFRYVIVEGLPKPPKPQDAQALMIESALKPAGAFECSNPILNKIHEVNLWTIRCLNLGGYMVDCPHRERMGYGADGQTSIDTQIMNLDASAFYAKWTTDWLDIQNRDTGKTGNFAPINDDPACWFLWGGMIDVLPWKTYLYYGNRRLLEKSHDQMAAYLEKYIEGFYPDGGIERKGGEPGSDWVTPAFGMSPPPGNELTANCYRVYLLDLLAKSAEGLGRADDAKRYRDRLKLLKERIHAKYFKPAENLYDSGRQLDQALPLLLGIVPEDLRGKVEKNLEQIILVKNKGHMDTGMLGTYFLFESLRQMGRNDLAYTMANQTSYPGWGYLLSLGATTFGEEWNGHWSQIHACFLNPGGWMHQGLAGILPDETGPGFKKFIIKPAVVGDLTWVKCHYDSMHGRIISNWKREGSKLTMNVTIPPNSTATVYVPGKDAASVTESGKPAASAAGVKFLRQEKGAAVYAVESGRYIFQSSGLPEIPKPPKVKILKATYGELPDGPVLDVTDKVRDLVQGGALSIDVSNASFGDPAPGRQKKLKVEYQMDGGKTRIGIAQETTTLMLVAPGEALPEKNKADSRDSAKAGNDPAMSGPAGYAWCAKEGDSFTLSGTHDVAYGANGKFAYLFNQTGIIVFTPEVFGLDPAPGVFKAGYYKRSARDADPLGVLRKPIPDKLVVLTFDDGCSTHATYVAPLLKSFGFGGSFYLCTLPSFPNKNWYMSWDQMKTMVRDGFEIGNHTREHTVGSGIGPFLDMEREMIKNGLAKPTTQAWPCYVPNTNTFADLSSNKYVFARGGHFRPYRPTVDHPLDIPSVNPKDMKKFVRCVQQAANGCVVVITYHGVPDYEHDFAGTEPGLFKQMMQYLKDNNYKVIALRDLARYIDPNKATKLPPTK